MSYSGKFGSKTFFIEPMRGYNVLSIKPMWGDHARWRYFIVSFFGYMFPWAKQE